MFALEASVPDDSRTPSKYLSCLSAICSLASPLSLCFSVSGSYGSLDSSGFAITLSKSGTLLFGANSSSVIAARSYQPPWKKFVALWRVPRQQDNIDFVLRLTLVINLWRGCCSLYSARGPLQLYEIFVQATHTGHYQSQTASSKHLWMPYGATKLPFQLRSVTRNSLADISVKSDSKSVWEE